MGSDSILHEVGAGAQKKKNRAIKRFRNRAISNRDFISISINRTALVKRTAFIQNRNIFQQYTSLLLKTSL